MKRTSKLPFLLIALGLVASLSSPQLKAQAGSGHHQVVLWESDRSGSSLEAEQRQALTEALSAVAFQAGVVVCFNDAYGVSDKAFEDVCMDHKRKLSKRQSLIWNVDVEMASQSKSRIVLLTLSMNVDGKKGRKHEKQLPKPLNIITQTEVRTPEAESGKLSHVSGETLYKLIINSGQTQSWFRQVANITTFLVERPAGAKPQPRVSHFHENRRNAPENTATDELASQVEEPGTERPLQAWDNARKQIVDLLIEGNAEEARSRAEKLLSQEGLPGDLAERTRELLVKAEEKISEAKSDNKITTTESRIEGKTTSEGASAGDTITETSPAEPAEHEESFDVTFKVRYAIPGKGGFRTGVDGRLRISSRDLSFLPDDRASGDNWSVPWRSLKSAGRAGGLWDVAHPLYIETNDGKKRYITEITRQGTYGKGEQVLAYIQKGRHQG